MASRRAEGGRCGEETAEGMVTVGDERRCWGRIHHGERNVMAKTENGRSGKWQANGRREDLFARYKTKT